MPTLSEAVSARTKTMVTSLWYPAVLGASLLLWLDHISGDKATFQTTLLALFQILYFSVEYAESMTIQGYGWPTFVADLLLIAVMYFGLRFLGLAPPYDTPTWWAYYLILGLGFCEPIIWRFLQGDRKIFRSHSHNSFLDGLCLFGIVGMGVVAFLHVMSDVPSWSGAAALAILWSILVLYTGAILWRATHSDA